MKDNILEGEAAALEVLAEIRELVALKEEYILKDDISAALLVHAINYIYQSSAEESDASHMIMNIISEVLLGEHNDLVMNDFYGPGHLKH